MLEQNNYFLLQLKLIIKCRVKGSVIIHQQRFVHRVIKVCKIKHLNRNAAFMPAMNTLSTSTHLNEVCFHLHYLYFELSLWYDCIALHLLKIFLAGKLCKSWWVLQCVGQWEPQPLHPEEFRKESQGQGTIHNCRLICGRLGSCEEVKNHLLLIKHSCNLVQANGSESLTGHSVRKSICGVRKQNETHPTTGQKEQAKTG